MAIKYKISTFDNKASFDAMRLVAYVKSQKANIDFFADEKSHSIDMMYEKLKKKKNKLREINRLISRREGNLRVLKVKRAKLQSQCVSIGEKLKTKKERYRNIIKYNPYIIQAQTKVSYRDHTKPLSLDMWMRRNVRGVARNTKQASNYVMEQLVQTRLFREHPALECPTTGRFCKGLILVR